MILLPLLLQSAAIPSAAVPPAAVPPVAPSAPPAAAPRSPAAGDLAKSIDPAVAIETFRTVCWAGFRDAQTFHAAVPTAPIALAQVDRPPPAGGTPAGEMYRSDEAVLTYLASDALPASIPSRQCSLRVRLASASDQLALAARVAAALGLPNGRTRTGPTLAITSWDVLGTDNRTTRLLAISRNGRSGGTELRLSALLLTAR